MRLTIKKHNQPLIAELAQQLGTDESEALNYLLLSLKAQKLNIPQLPQETISSIPLGFDIPKPSFAEIPASHIETDPIIQRFIDLGICDQF